MNEPWTRAELGVLRKLGTPWKIQQFLEETPYSVDPIYRSPRRVMLDRGAHCVDGALFAAAALRRIGVPPSVIWIDAENDDGHLLAPFRERGLWGAVAKSNCIGARWREPVHRSIRELVMSYFDEYFNILGQRSLRAYRTPMNLARWDKLNWMTSETNLERLLEVELEKQKKNVVVTPAMAKRLHPADPLRVKTQFVGANPDGLFKAIPGRRG